MCRIFYALNQPQLKHKIEQFLMQSDHPPPKYVEFTQKEDLGTRLSGYGLASLQTTGEWKIYKTPRTYKTEPHTAEYIAESAKSKLVIGHIRDKVDEASISLENTHPFSHENHIFIQNGRIYDFQDCKSAIVKKILAKYATQIRGETDTEHIFYLLLSCIERTPNIQDAFSRWLRILSRVSNKYTLNIVYANSTCSVITRKSYINRKKYPGETVPLLSLFWNGSLNREDKILVSSEPILKMHYPIPEDAILFIPHRDYIQ